MKDRLKVLYIFIVGIGVFFINQWQILLAIIVVHLLAFFVIENKSKSLKFLWKVRFFVLMIFSFHAFSGNNDIELLQIKKLTLALSFDGMLMGLTMVCKLIAMLMITQVIRLSMSKSQFVQGLRGVGLSGSSAEIIDEILDIVHAEKQSKKGSGAGRSKQSKTTEKNADSALAVLKGSVGDIPNKLLKRLDFASEQFKNNPNASIASASLAVTLIRMVKIAPGLPIAPGHKNVLMIPVFIYGIIKSNKRFAGFQIGMISGILHFFMGFGKYGPLGILEFAILGLVIDLMLLLNIKKTNLFYLMLIGAVAGLTRVATEIILAYLLGMPIAFYLLYLPYIFSQTLFGIASGFISKAILTKEDLKSYD